MRRNSQQSRSQNLVRSGLLLLLALYGTSTVFAEDFTPRFGHHTQTPENGVDENYSDFRAFVPFGDEDLLLFFDTRLLVDHNSEFGFNLGTGFRGQLGFDGFWGVNAFTDQRRTSFSTYHQIGFGWELMFEGLQFRNNFYVPVSQDRTILGSNSGGTLRFEDNFLYFDTIVRPQLQIEQALQGFDLEVGGELAEDLIDGATISGYLGAYYYDNPGLTDAPGISGRLNTNFSDSVVLNLGIQHDRFFKTQATFGMTLYTDILKRDRPAVRRSSHSLMNDPVYRKSAITIAQGTIGPPPEDVQVKLTNLDGSDLRVVHVDSSAPGGGDGTYENPLNNVGDVLANSQIGDNVYLYSGSTFSGQNTLQLQDSQRIFGEGGNFASLVTTQQLGTIALPAGNGLGGNIPIIQNSTNNAIELADKTGLVSNLSIINPFGVGIFGNSASALIDNVTISTQFDHGIQLQGTSQVTVDNSSITTQFGNGIQVLNNSQLGLFNSNITTHGDNDYGILARDDTIVGIDKGSSITTNGDGGYGIFHFHNSRVTVTEGSKITANGLNTNAILSQGESHLTVSNSSMVFSNTGVGIFGSDNANLTILDSDIIAPNNFSIFADAVHPFQHLRIQVSDNRLGNPVGTGTIRLHAHFSATISVIGAGSAYGLALQNGILPGNVSTTGDIQYIP